MSKTLFITGATSGFGKAIAQRFAKEGNNLIITGRRAERLENLKQELSKKYNIKVLTLCFDVRNESEVNDAIKSLPKEWQNIDVLINNAGLASGLSTLQDGNTQDWNVMIDTNVKGLLYVTHAVLPLLLKSKAPHIINIGSTAGKEVYLKGNIYCATKHAVNAISKALRIDLLEKGVKVTQISPGAAETEFSIVRLHGDEEAAKKLYNGYQPMVADDIANVVHFATTLPKHLCINDLELTSLAQANSYYTYKTE
ncbi:MAG: SDR family NAD(P)-dependent oxidoreductase [Flavobacteriales bacterium]|jgi:3-hydroxy acid dehydrogenase / malonic semialdehyde reductase|nr:SDR family NAD(P)-dependent oxidoreductase [Flavobacteriales bacterium]